MGTLLYTLYRWTRRRDWDQRNIFFRAYVRWRIWRYQA
jgi:hypothetical protein